MRRLRLLFAAFTLAMIAPVGLLVLRSLDSIKLESQIREQTIAERIFDEMEGSLSAMLAAEEARPVLDYQFRGGAADDSFVLSRFEIEGSQVEDTPTGAPDRDEAEGVGNLVKLDKNQVGRRENKKLAGGKAEPEVQMPGTTVRLGKSGRKASDVGADVAQSVSKRVSEYEVLRSLNNAATSRSKERAPKRKVTKRKVTDLLASRAGAPPVVAAPRESAREAAESDDLIAQKGASASHFAKDRLRALGYGYAAPPSVEDSDGKEEQRMAAAASGRLDFLDLRDTAFGAARLSGRAVGPDRIMLHRTVARGAAVYQQGVLLDIGLLEDWLQSKVLGDTADYATFALFTRQPSAISGVPDGGTLFSHRFAEPFSDLNAHLRLSPLSPTDSATYVYTLSALLVAASIIGIGLLYRSVAVTVRFAERRSNFVAAVSHELKTPLTAIRMYGEMLRDGVVSSDAKRQEYYRHITSESERLSRLINNVLDYSHLEKGTRNLNPTRVSVQPILEEVASMVRPHATDHGFAIEVECDANLPAAMVDADALSQILWNLLDNAIKYASSASDKRVHLRAVGDDSKICISVTDHGPGVAPRHEKNIFEPFYRGEDELTRRAKGTGLGLALVRDLATQMGASIEANNIDGGGFEVKIGVQVA